MPALLSPGQTLRDGEIEVIDQLGNGGVGEVYRVSVLKQGQRVVMALKCFNPKALNQSETEAIEIVHRESSAVSKIHHPGVISIYLTDLTAELPFLIEEYLPDGDLMQLITDRRKERIEHRALFSPQELAHIGHRISAALTIIHQNNLYHGDLKPQNICLRNKVSLDPVIVDFGHSGFMEGSILGRNAHLATLAYLPPERTGFVKMAGSASGDLYSLGATLYQVALGDPPISGDEGSDLINRLLYEVPKPLHEIFQDFPIALSDIIAKLLRKDPRDRYHSAFGLGADLARCLKSLENNEEIIPFALGTKDKLRELNYRIPIVGRTLEMSTLHHLFDEVLAGESNLALIGAPSGTGKSRLAFEILHKAKERTALISYVKFSEYERNFPLSAVTLLLIDHCYYLKTLSPEQLKAWQNKIELALGKRLHLIVEHYNFYAPYIPVQSKGKGKALEGELGFQAFNQTLGEFLSLLPACQESQLILIDDLQWADWQSLQVFAMLAAKIARKEARQTMFMGTYRSNEITENHPLIPSLLSMQDQFTLIELGPLDRPDADALVELLLDESGEEIAKLQDVCYRFTQGNPFFIYEYLKSAIHTGIYAIEEATQIWKFHEDRISSQDLSNGVAGLVADRILSLGSAQQALVSITSIAGHAMKRSALKQLLPFLIESRKLADEQLLEQNWDRTIEMSYQQLLQKNLLTPDSDRFAFFHDKIQEACYSLLNETEKQLLHCHFGKYSVDAILEAKEKVTEATIFEAAYHVCRGRSTRLSKSIRGFLFTASESARNVFAYDKAKEYLQTLIQAIEAETEIDLSEKFDALEMLADTLVISEQIQEAMVIYDQLLTLPCEPIRVAKIYAKKVEFCLNLIDYKQAKESCSAGLDVLGVKIFEKELPAYLFIAIALPFLFIYAVYFKYFGRQNKKLTDEKEDIRLLLLLKSEISLYCTKPIVAIANIIPLSFKLLRYEDCEYRALLYCYWAIVFGYVGRKKLADQFFQRAYDYFDKNANPVNKGFILYVWGICLDLPLGDLEGARAKFEVAVSTLESVGESFWRSMAIMNLIIIDYFGAETGQAGIRCHELVELWKKIGYTATPLGSTLRYYLEAGNHEQIKFLLGKIIAAEKNIVSQGYDSLDAVWACNGLAEYYDYQIDPVSAEIYAKKAFSICIKRFHRAAYTLHPPIIYSRILIKQGKLIKAFGVLCYAWINLLFNVNLFKPHTHYETGRWLSRIGLNRLARSSIETGIRYAVKKNWLTPLAEGRLILGQVLAVSNPDLSMAYFHMAREYFQQRNWQFHEQLAEQGLKRKKSSTTALTGTLNEKMSMRRGTGLRQQIEVQALMDVLLKLSAITEKGPLFRALLEALSQATGSELAVLYFEESGSWQAKLAHNVKVEAGDLFKTKVDVPFVQNSLKERILEPTIRRAKEQGQDRSTTTGSAMLLPLIADGKVYGYCYLANTQIYELFDQRSIDIARPIATQGAIALQNIRLNEQLAVERDETANLNLTLEQRVIEQTRDIKNIMEHIEIGICTVSGDSIKIDRDYSRFLKGMLNGDELKDKPLLPLLLGKTNLNEDEIDQIKHALRSSMNEDKLNFELNEHLLPLHLTKSLMDKSSFNFELEWIPICDEQDKVEKILVTINDVTELRGLQAIAAKKDQELQLISEILNHSEVDWSKFRQSSQVLLDKSTAQLSALKNGAEPLAVLKKIFIQVHTLKGNSRSYGFRHLNKVIHEIEQFFSASIRLGKTDLTPEQLERQLSVIAAAFNEYEAVATEKLGRFADGIDAVSIERQSALLVYEQLRVLQNLKSQIDPKMGQSLKLMRNVLFKSVEGLMQQLVKELEPIAIQMHKEPPVAVLNLPELWIDSQAEDLLRNCFVHLLRNSLDHGLQSSDERQAKGLGLRGTISLTASIQDGLVKFYLSDDGRGLNLKRLRDLGLQKNLLSIKDSHDPNALAALILRADFSTVDAITDVSGRGMGMAAVVEVLHEVGGELLVAFDKTKKVDEDFAAIFFIISLPLNVFQTDEVALYAA